MIKISIPLTIEIEEKRFSITYRHPTKRDQKEIENSLLEAGRYEAMMKASHELSAIEERMRINEGILTGDPSMLERGKLWLEQKSLLDKKLALQARLLEETKTLDSEQIFRRRFELLVGGEDKATLEAEAERLGIGFERLMEEIELGVEAEKEKK